jgi:hypothetical protein
MSNSYLKKFRKGRFFNTNDIRKPVNFTGII